MEKVLIRKVSDWWGEYDCSSNRNMPKYIQWLSRETETPHEVSVYVDNYIKEGDVSYRWILRLPK